MFKTITAIAAAIMLSGCVATYSPGYSPGYVTGGEVITTYNGPPVVTVVPRYGLGYVPYGRQNYYTPRYNGYRGGYRGPVYHNRGYNHGRYYR